jgi:ABC-type proline/glycine betaine transport system permease subunit
MSLISIAALSLLVIGLVVCGIGFYFYVEEGNKDQDLYVGIAGVALVIIAIVIIFNRFLRYKKKRSHINTASEFYVDGYVNDYEPVAVGG